MLRRSARATLFPYTTLFRSCREGRSGAGRAKGGDQGKCGPAKHVPGAEPDKRVTGAGTHTAICRHIGRVQVLSPDTDRTVLWWWRSIKRTSLPLRAPGKVGA